MDSIAAFLVGKSASSVSFHVSSPDLAKIEYEGFRLGIGLLLVAAALLHGMFYSVVQGVGLAGFPGYAIKGKV